MPRTKEQNDLVKEERKENILDCAFSLFALKQNKLTIDDICGKSKCSHGIIYHYYKSVDDIVEKIYKSGFYNTIKRSLFIELDKDSNPIEKVRNLIKKMMSFYDEKSVATITIIIREIDKNSLKEKLDSIIKEGQSSFQFVGGEPNEIIDILFSFFKGKYLDFLLNRKSKIIYPSIDNVMKIITRMVI